MDEEIKIMERFGGRHLLATFLIFFAAGFATVYLDYYAFSKLESAVGVTPTVF